MIFQKKRSDKKKKSKRAANKNKTRSKRSYEGAKKGRRLANWFSSDTSANAEISGDLAVLRQRSRDLVRNNPYAARAVNVIHANTVGHGIIGKWSHPSKEVQKKLNEEWKKWAETKAIDYDDQLNIYGLQRLAIRSTAEGGECLAIANFNRRKNGIPLEIQLLEGDYLEIHRNNRPHNGRDVLHSIEFDKNGKRAAYHLWENHPGDARKSKIKTRVPASRVEHIFRLDRIGQMRGVPWGAPAIVRLKDFKDFEDAQLVRQKIAACFTAFIHDSSFDIGEEMSEEESQELGEKVEPGQIELLPPGKTVTFGKPPEVSNYKEYSSTALKAVSIAFGITYEALTNDYSDVNFSSARMGHLEMNRNLEEWRRDLMQVKLLNFVAEKFKQAFSLKFGQDLSAATMLWTPPRREIIDPTKEIPAKVEAVRAGFSSKSDAIREMGNNPDEVFGEIEEENKTLDEKGIVLDSDPRKVNQSGALQG